MSTSQSQQQPPCWRRYSRVAATSKPPISSSDGALVRAGAAFFDQLVKVLGELMPTGVFDRQDFHGCSPCLGDRGEARVWVVACGAAAFRTAVRPRISCLAHRA